MPALTETVDLRLRVSYAPEPYGLQFSLVFQVVADDGSLAELNGVQAQRVHAAVAAALGRSKEALGSAWKPRNVLTLPMRRMSGEKRKERIINELTRRGIKVVEP